MRRFHVAAAVAALTLGTSAAQAQTYDVQIAPFEDPEGRSLAALANAQATVDVAQYNIRNDRFFDALTQLRDRGVRVRVVGRIRRGGDVRARIGRVHRGFRVRGRRAGGGDVLLGRGAGVGRGCAHIPGGRLRGGCAIEGIGLGGRRRRGGDARDDSSPSPHPPERTVGKVRHRTRPTACTRRARV